MSKEENLDLDLGDWEDLVGDLDQEPEKDVAPEPEPAAEPEIEVAATPAPAAKPETKPAAKPRSRAKPKAESAPAPVTHKGASGENMAQQLRRCKKVEIMIHEMEDTPPGGIPVIIGGYAFHIFPGKWVKVPEPVLEVLEHAQETKAVVQNGTIVGYTTVSRFPYSVRECAQ